VYRSAVLRLHERDSWRPPPLKTHALKRARLGGVQAIRGVAYDSDKRRLFASEHDASKADGVHNALCIMGLPASG
jgi:hypothetical protein